jgi:ABC-type sugar transport system permease subunit
MQKNLAFYLFIAPWLLGLIFLVLLPVLGGVAISFTNYDGLNLGNVKFLGSVITLASSVIGMRCGRSSASWYGRR